MKLFYYRCRMNDSQIFSAPMKAVSMVEVARTFLGTRSVEKVSRDGFDGSVKGCVVYRFRYGFDKPVSKGYYRIR